MITIYLKQYNKIVREADIKLDYGNGATLELWETKVKNARNNRGIGMVVQFTNEEGSVYCYDTDRLRPEKFPLKKPGSH